MIQKNKSINFSGIKIESIYFLLASIFLFACDSTTSKKDLDRSLTMVMDHMLQDALGNQNDMQMLVDQRLIEDMTKEVIDLSSEEDMREQVDIEMDQAMIQPLPSILINEVDCYGTDRIELINLESFDVDLADWMLTDELQAIEEAFRLSDLNLRDRRDDVPSTVIPAYGFLKIEAQSSDAIGFTFGISCMGEQLFLLSPQAEVIDMVELNLDLPRAYTYGRIPDAGSWQITQETIGQSNHLPSQASDPLFDLFAHRTIPVISLQLSEEAISLLFQNSTQYVPASFSFESEINENLNDPQSPYLSASQLDIELRIKGKYGSYRDLNGKPALKLKFNRPDRNQRWLGLKELTLNNMVQDGSMLHEKLAYGLFQQLGLVAPRVSYAWLKINEMDYGLYLILEGVDDVLLDQYYASTQHLYEGEYGMDFFGDFKNSFQIDEGNDDRSDLIDLIDFLDQQDLIDPTQTYVLTQDLIDWDRVLKFMALEIFIGHWDGYSSTRNNYSVHFDDNGRLSLLPWGLDQTFDARLNFYEGAGRLLWVCLANADCLEQYSIELLSISNMMDESDIRTELETIASLIFHSAQADPRKEYSIDFPSQIDTIIGFISDRKSQFACYVAPPELSDPDGDGSICQFDCEPNRADIYPEAFDICGDLIDNNCNGVVDDDASCPVCVPLAQTHGYYWICKENKSWFSAKESCESMSFLSTTGMEVRVSLAAFRSLEEQALVINEALLFTGWRSFWIGANDLNTENSFVWNDGIRLDIDHWYGGQPDNYADIEDCTEAYLDGWNDLPCDWEIFYLCSAE